MVDQRDAREVHVGLASPPNRLVFTASLLRFEPLAPEQIALLQQEANRSKLIC
jgi:hypothetical protein